MGLFTKHFEHMGRYLYNTDKMTDVEIRDVELMSFRCLRVIQNYAWLLDSFVLEFFTEQHWKRMPICWQTFLSSIQPEELGSWISRTPGTSSSKVWPLSLLALRNIVHLHTLPRQPDTSENGTIRINSTFGWMSTASKETNIFHTFEETEKGSMPLRALPLPNIQAAEDAQINLVKSTPGEPTQCITHPSLQSLFTKHVKPKKRHEIWAMAKICSKTAQHLNCMYVVDVGAGKGHLSRLLSYGYGLRVCCLEAQNDLTQTARKLDEELEYTAKKHIGDEAVATLPRPTHINILLDPQKHPTEFVQELQKAFGVPSSNLFTFGIVGLHPCGDLAPTLLRLYSACSEAKFISIVGCCYMKLTLNPNGKNKLPGYPLSQYFRSLPSSTVTQSYEALEIACHALEEYSLRLQHKEYSDLKIHNYRAVLEQIIVGIYPEKRRLGLRSVKHAHKMNFSEYARVAISRAGIDICDEALDSAHIQNSLECWKQVVVFYTLRLLVAPLVETVVLLDRLLYLAEEGNECCILPGFDPLLSPRNHILLGCKK